MSIFYYLVPVADDRKEIIDGAKNAVEKTTETAKQLAPKAKKAAKDLLDKAKGSGESKTKQ